jgi:hypothetical protein
MAKKARTRKRKVTYRTAVRALDDAGVPNEEIGRFSADGKNLVLNQRVLDSLRKGKKRKVVRFRALNAPFKRQSGIAPT